MSVPLPDEARALFDRPVYATVATAEPSGMPQQTVVWIKTEGDDVVFSTIEGRRKYLNLQRDQRASVLAFDPVDPYFFVVVRGTTTMTTEGGPELIDELSYKYKGTPYTGDIGTDHVRVVVRITPEKVFVRRP